MAGDDEPHGGEQLRRSREAAGMTVAEVAARAGVAGSQLADVEDGIGLADGRTTSGWHWYGRPSHRARIGGTTATSTTGCHVGRLHGAAVETDDVDVVPDTSPEIPAAAGRRPQQPPATMAGGGMAGGVETDGRWLEPRHFHARSTAVPSREAGRVRLAYVASE